ncbi:Lds2p SKDI_15G1130 [Saccharomyces kudriavzevii IFO 1802]|uniref:Outer spore wall protein LDS2 n=1 Tax=Saccharomyces kudriavzevii (strain ATCC MYA-4449 / AS 2.2408 / CBS 8840 / NBRC 1802 / NCYC 2889) TaxID=226230 RepID=A0AA35NKV3_SACK1|nr:uncharacterized protein SKDI_15G1130 [Saccharomyces kudriavzevii IFO 1802]CAI4050999.1 hypothetical protein SKDI_15G1130 [Saccharomyces kudriavzevii IFO 1802]
MSTRAQPDWYYHRHPYASTPLAEGEEPRLLPIQDQSNHKKSKIWRAYKVPIVQWYKNAMLIKKGFWHDLESSHQIIWYPYKGISESVGSMDYMHLFFLIFGYYLLSLALIVAFTSILACSLLVFIYLPFLGFFALPLAYVQTVLIATTLCNSMVKGTDFVLFTRIYGVTFARKKLPILSEACETISFTPFVYRRSHRLGSLFSTQFYLVSLPHFFIFFFWYVSIAIIFLLLLLIPIVGPITINMLPFSPGMGFYYFEPYFVDVLHLDSRKLSKVYYKGFAKWLLFSISSGLLESIPILGGLFIGTNVVGASLWIVKEINDHEQPAVTPSPAAEPDEPVGGSYAPPIQQSIAQVNPP